MDPHELSIGLLLLIEHIHHVEAEVAWISVREVVRTFESKGSDEDGLLEAEGYPGRFGLIDDPLIVRTLIVVKDLPGSFSQLRRLFDVATDLDLGRVIIEDDLHQGSLLHLVVLHSEHFSVESVILRILGTQHFGQLD